MKLIDLKSREIDCQVVIDAWDESLHEVAMEYHQMRIRRNLAVGDLREVQKEKEKMEKSLLKG